MAALTALNEAVTACRRCPRLVEWRELVAREKRAAFRDETYWGRPVAGFGDPAARVLVLGLAPAAHGGKRPGGGVTGGSGGQPHGARVPRRSVGRLALRGDAPRGLREPADFGGARRRSRAHRRV